MLGWSGTGRSDKLILKFRQKQNKTIQLEMRKANNSQNDLEKDNDDGVEAAVTAAVVTEGIWKA